MVGGPWSPDEFRDLFGEIPAVVRASFRLACNRALREGLTRQAVIDAYGSLPRDHPEVLAATTALSALRKRGDA